MSDTLKQRKVSVRLTPSDAEFLRKYGVSLCYPNGNVSEGIRGLVEEARREFAGEINRRALYQAAEETGVLDNGSAFEESGKSSADDGRDGAAARSPGTKKMAKKKAPAQSDKPRRRARPAAGGRAPKRKAG